MIGRALLAAALLVLAPQAAAERVFVATAPQLVRAIEQAKPGDIITLAPGTYRLGRVPVVRPGEPAFPIVVTAGAPGLARIESAAEETFWVAAPWWVFENLEMVGVCGDHSNCEHAFHLVGGASRVTIRNSVLRDFNAQIKANGTGAPVRQFPDEVRIENNALFNTTPRRTGNPVTPVDVVGGQRWLVRGNFIADFAKDGGDGISYAGFLKGNSREGVFERNLVLCEWRHKGGIRVGLSFGGGGTSPGACEGGDCGAEHRDGVMRNNVIALCPQEVGIYLNRAAGTRLYNNLLYETAGIDVRFSASDADIRNNVVSGGIRERDGGRARLGLNWVAGTWMAPWAPGGGRWLRAKIEGARKKYPNWVTVEPAVADELAAWFGGTCFGRCPAGFRDWYAAPELLDFRLRPGQPVIDGGEALAAVTDDFCGRPRVSPPHDLGPIEYGDADCDIRARIPDLPAR